jgi:isorenieratene synthase
VTEGEIRDDFRRQLHDLYPETREAQVIHQRFLLRRDCPSFAPGTYQERTTVPTPMNGIALAGDFVKLPFPSALMERAVASGFYAASHVLARWAVRPEPLWSVPPRGLLAGLRAVWS